MLLRNWLILVFILSLAVPVFGGEIHRAIEREDLAKVQSLVAADAAVLEAPDENEFRDLPMHVVAATGNLEIAKFLLAEGADVNGYDKDESTPLMVAAIRKQPEMAALLIKKGADVRKVDLNGGTAVAFAAGAGQLEIAQMLAKAGADFDVTMNNGNSLLHHAAAGGNADMVKMLLKQGMAVDARNEENATPLMYAAMRGRADATALLLKHGADPLAVNDHGQHALLECSFRGNKETAAHLIAAGSSLSAADKWGRTPLFCAAWIGQDELVALYLKHGADPNVTNERGQTPLIKATEKGSLANVKALLAAGAEPGASETGQGRTALHVAAVRGYGDVTQELIASGAALTVLDGSKQTPLELAGKHGNQKCMKVLAKAGAGKSGTTEACQLAGKTKKCADKHSKCCGSLATMKQPAEGEAVVWYLGHSAMAIKTHDNLLIFDYYEDGRVSDTPGMANGCICPDEIAGQKVTVFASHSHGDHYDPVIFDWREKVQDITYVLGFESDDKDVPAHEIIGPRQTRRYGDLTVHTIKSNDSGVGFLVEVDGLKIFHAGDHANRTRDFSGDYCAEIDYLVAAGHHPDLTMLPTTGCNFGDQVAVRLGITYTLEKFGKTTFFPMHAGSNPQRYIEVWEEVGPKCQQVKAVIPADNGDWHIYGKESTIEQASAR